MIEEVYPHIYQIRIPLPNNPLKALNSYLIKGEERSLLVDTGFNCEESEKTLLHGIEAIGINLHNLDVFITHLHADHSGLAGLFTNTSHKIYASKIDADFMNMIPSGEHEIKANKKIKMLDLLKYSIDFNDLPGHKYAYRQPIDFDYVKEGDLITIGNYQFEIIEVSGHTPGMIGLYERNLKLYFSTDHILDQISPNITFWDFKFNALDHYIQNLNKVIDLDINILFPAHRNIMTDHPRRAKELIIHHEERIKEVFNIIGDEPISPSQVASKMSWNIRADSWDAFPKTQKYFATGEAMAHLEYLYHDNQLIREEKKGIIYYSRIRF